MEEWLGPCTFGPHSPYIYIYISHIPTQAHGNRNCWAWSDAKGGGIAEERLPRRARKKESTSNINFVARYDLVEGLEAGGGADNTRTNAFYQPKATINKYMT